MDLLELSTKAAADGLPIRCVAPPRPIGALLGLTGSQNPFAGTRTYRSIAGKPLAELVAAMRDPAIRAQILADDPWEFNTWSLLSRVGFERMFRFSDPLNYTPSREDSITAIAERKGVTPQEIAYDMLIEDDGKDFIFACLVNYAHYNLEAVKTMYARQHVIPGLSDGGAHVAFISARLMTVTNELGGVAQFTYGRSWPCPTGLSGSDFTRLELIKWQRFGRVKINFNRPAPYTARHEKRRHRPVFCYPPSRQPDAGDGA